MNKKGSTPRRLLWCLIPIICSMLLIQPATSLSVTRTPFEIESDHLQPTMLNDPPTVFDLRDVDGENYVTGIRDQGGYGTCWAHGTMAAVESNMLMTDEWSSNDELGAPDLSEAHLDWWNGFNTHNNDDDPGGDGLTPHFGGDYRVSSAYMTRGEGNIREIDAPYSDITTPADRSHKVYHYYYPREIAWFVAEPDLSNIDIIKTMVMQYGAVGTCMCVKGEFFDGYIHYQPPVNDLDPNHAIAIIGWDDTKQTQADDPGAWLCKNSWGDGWGINGYFWISYYDKHCGQHPEMGAVSYQDVERIENTYFYYHDYHGWRDTLPEIQEAVNVFTVENEGSINAVSFYTAADTVDFTVVIYDDFEDGLLENELARESGTIDFTGYHTIDLSSPVNLPVGDQFYIYLNLSHGGQPIDRTSEIPVLLGLRGDTIVESAANAGESFYKNNGEWYDLYDYSFADPQWNNTANFCMKAISGLKTAAYQVSDIQATMGRLSGSVENIGEAEGNNIVCSIKIMGGLLGRIAIESEDIIESLSVGSKETFSTDQLVFGLGKVEITIAVDYTVKWTGEAVVVGPFLLGVQQTEDEV